MKFICGRRWVRRWGMSRFDVGGIGRMEVAMMGFRGPRLMDSVRLLRWLGQSFGGVEGWVVGFWVCLRSWVSGGSESGGMSLHSGAFGLAERWVWL